MDQVVFHFLNILQNCSSEFLSFLTFLVCAVSILAFLRWFGAIGLYTYNALAVVAANIQVLKMAEFSFCSEPVALGTVVFATTFLVSDILTEHYGAAAARQALWLSFITQILMSVWMVLTLGHPSPNYYSLAPDLAATLIANEKGMSQLFIPSLRILTASLISYFISQQFDIWVFQKIRDLSSGRFIWLRQNMATALSGLLDNFIFALIAWVVLSTNPIPFSLLISSFVFASYILRGVVNIISTPVMYLSYRFLPKSLNNKIC